MIARLLFMSAAAFVAYRYISNSNKKAKELREGKREPVAILPPEAPGTAKAEVSHASPKALASAKARPSSSATEDLGDRY